MMNDDQAMAATPHTELIAELMNPNNPKNEREHAAVREIERLREDQQGVDAVDTLTEEGWTWDGDQWQRPAQPAAINEAFAELVTEQANARANTSWALMCKKMVADEREACAKVCDAWDEWAGTEGLLAKAIRARGNT